MTNEHLDLNELLEDVRRIKSTIKQNAYIFQSLLYSLALKLAFLIAGTTAMLVPFLYYSYIQQYGDYTAVPAKTRLSLILIIVAGTVLVSIVKFIAYFKAKRLISQPSILKIFSRLVSRQALALYPGFIATILFFVVFFITQDNNHFIVPTLAIGMGIVFSMIGSFISLPDLLFLGSYLWLTGLLSVPFINKDPLASLLWTSVIFGLGMLGFGLYLIIKYRQEKGH